MEVRTFDLIGPVEIRPRILSDDRGYFAEIFRANVFAQHVPDVKFVQENQSLNVRSGTIRGIHFQSPPAGQGKLVRCLAGKLFDLIVDLRRDSVSYGQSLAVILSAAENNQLWVPVGFGHAFCTLEPNSIVSYRVTSYYSPEHDKGVAWDDPDIAVSWPDVADPTTLSTKDRSQPSLAELPAYFSMKDR
jgi:dTDP-4-dehydrorhamnose 3,5-epimerase